MIKSEAVAAWLADPAARRRTSDGIDACRLKWAHHPSFAELDAAVRAGPNSAQALIAIARRYLDRTDDIDALIQDLIANGSADPFFQPPFGSLVNDIMQGLLLYHHPKLLLGICVTRLEDLAEKKASKRTSGSINFTGYLSLLRFIDGGDALFTLWEAPRIGDDFVAAEAGRCRISEQRRIVDGEEIVMDGRHQSYTIDHAVRDLVYFQAVALPDAAPVSAEFDSESCELIGTSSTSEAASRIQMMATLLRAMDCREGMPLLEASLSSPQFYTRWHVMREMLALDAEGSLPALRRLAETDPHPDVRFAARETLAAFFSDAEPSLGESPCPV